MVEVPLCPICEERPQGHYNCAVCGTRVCTECIEKFEIHTTYENEFGNEIKAASIEHICCECSIGEWMSFQLMREGIVDIEIRD